jgi:hypothetical protein
MTSSFAGLGRRMGTGDEVDLAIQPGTPPAMPSALRTAARRPADGDRALVLDAGGENVIVVLAEEGCDAGQIWEFIQQRLVRRKKGRM